MENALTCSNFLKILKKRAWDELAHPQDGLQIWVCGSKINFFNFDKNWFWTRKPKFEVCRVGVKTHPTPFFSKYVKSLKTLGYFSYLYQRHSPLRSKVMWSSNLVKSGEISPVTTRILAQILQNLGFSQKSPKMVKKC